MRRRDLLALICGVSAASPTWAQAPVKQYRIAVLSPALSATEWREVPFMRSFFSELRRLAQV